MRLFLRLGTQWRYGGMGGVTGLDYAAVQSVMQMRRVKAAERPLLLEQLQVMERAALREMNKS